MGVSQCQDNMGVKLNISLLLSLVSVTAAASLQEDNSEGEARFLFANCTSGLLALMSVNSSTSGRSPPRSWPTLSTASTTGPTIQVSPPSPETSTCCPWSPVLSRSTPSSMMKTRTDGADVALHVATVRCNARYQQTNNACRL